MKHISYYDILPGAIPLFNAVDNVLPEVMLDDMKWGESRVFSHNDPSIICVPTWNWEFDSLMDLPKFLHHEMRRDGYYTITGRRCDQEKIYRPHTTEQVYFSCFGMAYSPIPWIKRVHHWTSLEQDSKLPLWLTGWNPDVFNITQIR